jgi:hypothetical protein
MPTFIAYFKTGAKVAIKADGWYLDSTRRLVFETVKDDKSKHVYINTGELLYVVPADLLGQVPLDLK